MCVGCRSSNGNTSREQGKAKQSKAKQKADRQTGRLSGTDRHKPQREWCVLAGVLMETRLLAAG
jgi:hypothetical protein